MAEEQNQDNATLADILKEIKDMKGDVKVQYRDSQFLAAYVLGVTVTLVGVGFWMTLYTSLLWQRIDASIFIILGMSLMAYALMRRRKLREKQTKTKEGT